MVDDDDDTYIRMIRMLKLSLLKSKRQRWLKPNQR